MFFEQLENLTKAHFQLHLDEAFEQVKTLYGDKKKLERPKVFDVSTIVGGVVGLSTKTVPAFALAAVEKAWTPDEDDVWTYSYSGILSGMVGAMGPQGKITVERQVRRYAAAFEMIIKNHHRAPVPDDYDQATYPFRIKAFGFQRVDFFGAASLAPAANQEFWIDGFHFELLWEVIESGPGQHHDT